MKKVNFSRHAITRIEQGDERGLRTKLSVEEIADILNDVSKHIFLYAKKGFCFKLFYSNEDKNHFVAIQSNDGHVLTIEPINYCPNPCPLTDEILDKAEMAAKTKKSEILV